MNQPFPRGAALALFTLALLLAACRGEDGPRTAEEREVPVVRPAGDPAMAAAAAPRYNVLLIIFDDLNDWVSPLGGHPDVHTPQFEKLARKGLVFTNSYCDAPACNPSRTALLSGLRPSTTGVYFNGQPYLAALPGSYTLIEYFRAHGYRTLGSGKIFHTFGPGKNVWDEHFDKTADPEPMAQKQDQLFDDDHFLWGPLDIGFQKTPDYRVARAAAKWLSKPSDRPFFLAVGFHRPHLPWQVPKRFFDLYPLEQVKLPPQEPADLLDVPRYARRLARQQEHRKIVRTGSWPAAVQGYLASVSFADAVLGVVMKALDSGPHAGNTIVVVTSDHGFHLGEKKHWGKYSLWREATRIPLIIAVPGKPGGNTTASMTTLVDLYPTLVELCGLTPAQNLDGVSLAPLFEDPQQPWPHPALTVHRLGNFAVRDGDWTFIRYRDGGRELYHSKLDPREHKNLSERPKLQRKMKVLARSIPELTAPNAPYAFNPLDMKSSVRDLLRFFPPEKLTQEIERQSEDMEARRETRRETEGGNER